MCVLNTFCSVRDRDQWTFILCLSFHPLLVEWFSEHVACYQTHLDFYDWTDYNGWSSGATKY